MRRVLEYAAMPFALLFVVCMAPLALLIDPHRIKIDPDPLHDPLHDPPQRDTQPAPQPHKATELVTH